VCFEKRTGGVGEEGLRIGVANDFQLVERDGLNAGAFVFPDDGPSGIEFLLPVAQCEELRGPGSGVIQEVDLEELELEAGRIETIGKRKELGQKILIRWESFGRGEALDLKIGVGIGLGEFVGRQKGVSGGIGCDEIDQGIFRE
jgi:hypothetical protein